MIQTQKDQLIGDLRQSRYTDVLAAYPDIHLIEGAAAFQPDGSVRVGDTTYRAERYLISTGARPRMVPFPGLGEVEPLDSTSLMDLTKLPESLIVFGGRAIALELGQMAARLGVNVTILQSSGRLVPDHEPELGRALQQYLQEEGIQVVTGVHIEQLSREGDTLIVHARVLGKARHYRADQILIALGRQANTEHLH